MTLLMAGGGHTPVSDTSAITPPCSPPCDVLDGLDREEGELVETEIVTGAEDISDGEDNAKGLGGGCVFDSPASPDMDPAHHVSGSPLKIIPRSPMREIPGNEEEEEEDMDEDLLYLRLIALRSLAEENKTEDAETAASGDTDNNLAQEMKELLEEAEDAANENSDKVETAVISEVITIDDEDDDDPISEMKLNLHETYLKCQVSGAGDLLSLDSYSPTQSPVYVAPCSPDPSTFPVVDLTSPYSPSQSPSHPPLPPLPPPVPSRLPTPPPPPSMSPIRMTLSRLSLPEPVPTTSTISCAAPEAILSKHGEPLPPGEDKDPASPPGLQDMDIDPAGTETAETNFFLSQQNLFPASVWDFSSNHRAPSGPRHSRDSPTTETSVVSEEKKRKHEEIDTEESHTSQDETNEDEFEEEEASLRSLLLAQVGKKKSKLSEEKVSKDVSGGSEVLKQQDEKKLDETSQVQQNPKGHSASPPKKAKRVKQRETGKANTKQSQVPGIKKSKGKTKPRPKQVKITDAEQRKYFPNLSRKIVVNFSGNESDSDSSDSDNVSNDNQSDQSKSNPVKDSLFGLDLEAFLKQARNSSELTKTQQENQIKRTKKIAMTPKLKAKASELTLADKKKLISAKITHLSKSKQLEYQRLKEILAKKQLEKKLKAQKTSQPKQIVEHPKALEKSHSITEEEEEALRSNLIQNMVKSKKIETENEVKGEKDKNGTLKEASTGKELLLSPQKAVSTKPKMSIELSGDSREVKLNNPDKEDSEKGTQLKKFETDVVEMRKSLSASLFKLSAYMSQLQKETSGVDSAVNYIAELKKQLEETEKLLSTREKKVDSLKEVIKESHQQITIQKQEMSSVEERCRVEGFKLLGADYKPPVEGAENIRKKLEMIRSTAMKVKTTRSLNSETNSGEGKSGNIEGGAGSGPGLPGDYRSPLEHLSQNNKPLVDHSKEVCRYDLSGKCLDPGCQMQHLAPV